GALIPLNRSASRRGIARVARATLEAIASGRLPEERDTRELSEPPARVAREAEPTPAPIRVAHVERPAKDESLTEPPSSVVEASNEPETTPHAAPALDASATPPAAFTEPRPTPPPLDVEEEEIEFEVVSNLPPLVDELESTQRADRVRELVESF